MPPPSFTYLSNTPSLQAYYQLSQNAIFRISSTPKFLLPCLPSEGAQGHVLESGGDPGVLGELVCARDEQLFGEDSRVEKPRPSRRPLFKVEGFRNSFGFFTNRLSKG